MKHACWSFLRQVELSGISRLKGPACCFLHAYPQAATPFVSTAKVQGPGSRRSHAFDGSWRQPAARSQEALPGAGGRAPACADVVRTCSSRAPNAGARCALRASHSSERAAALHSFRTFAPGEEGSYFARTGNVSNWIRRTPLRSGSRVRAASADFGTLLHQQVHVRRQHDREPRPPCRVQLQ
jgi:hypothetical protein